MIDLVVEYDRAEQRLVRSGATATSIPSAAVKQVFFQLQPYLNNTKREFVVGHPAGSTETLIMRPYGPCDAPDPKDQPVLVGYDTPVMADEYNIQLEAGPYPNDDTRVQNTTPRNGMVMGRLGTQGRPPRYQSDTAKGHGLAVDRYGNYGFRGPDGTLHAPLGRTSSLRVKPRVRVILGKGMWFESDAGLTSEDQSPPSAGAEPTDEPDTYVTLDLLNDNGMNMSGLKKDAGADGNSVTINVGVGLEINPQDGTLGLKGISPQGQFVRYFAGKGLCLDINPSTGDGTFNAEVAQIDGKPRGALATDAGADKKGLTVNLTARKQPVGMAGRPSFVPNAYHPMYAAGHAAHRTGLGLDANPHTAGTTACAWWRLGWRLASRGEGLMGPVGLVGDATSADGSSSSDGSCPPAPASHILKGSALEITEDNALAWYIAAFTQGQGASGGSGGSDPMCAVSGPALTFGGDDGEGAMWLPDPVGGLCARPEGAYLRTATSNTALAIVNGVLASQVDGKTIIIDKTGNYLTVPGLKNLVDNPRGTATNPFGCDVGGGGTALTGGGTGSGNGSDVPVGSGSGVTYPDPGPANPTTGPNAAAILGYDCAVPPKPVQVIDTTITSQRMGPGGSNGTYNDSVQLPLTHTNQTITHNAQYDGRSILVAYPDGTTFPAFMGIYPNNGAGLWFEFQVILNNAAWPGTGSPKQYYCSPSSTDATAGEVFNYDLRRGNLMWSDGTWYVATCEAPDWCYLATSVQPGSSAHIAYWKECNGMTHVFLGADGAHLTEVYHGGGIDTNTETWRFRWKAVNWGPPPGTNFPDYAGLNLPNPAHPYTLAQINGIRFLTGVPAGIQIENVGGSGNTWDGQPGSMAADGSHLLGVRLSRLGVTRTQAEKEALVFAPCAGCGGTGTPNPVALRRLGVGAAPAAADVCAQCNGTGNPTYFCGPMVSTADIDTTGDITARNGHFTGDLTVDGTLHLATTPWVTQLNGQTGSLTLSGGDGIGIAAAGPDTPDIIKVTNTGVLSLNGRTGAVGLSAVSGSGITVAVDSQGGIKIGTDGSGAAGTAGVTNLNGAIGAVTLAATAPLQVAVGGQTVTLSLDPNWHPWLDPNAGVVTSLRFGQAGTPQTGALEIDVLDGLFWQGATLHNAYPGYHGGPFHVHDDATLGIGTLDVDNDVTLHGGRLTLAPAGVPVGISSLNPAAGSELGVGLYYCMYTVVIAGAESPASAVVPVTTLAGQQRIVWSFAAEASNVTARRLYRSVVNGTAAALGRVAELAGNGATSYTDSVPDASLGAGPTTAPSIRLLDSYTAGAGTATTPTGSWGVDVGGARKYLPLYDQPVAAVTSTGGTAIHIVGTMDQPTGAPLWARFTADDGLTYFMQVYPETAFGGSAQPGQMVPGDIVPGQP